MSRRRHGRIRDELPAEVREQVDRLLIEGGATYDDIKAFLEQGGYDISRSAIGRYGKDFLAMYQRLRVVEDKSRALISDAGDGLILEEAASKIFAQMILEAQLKGELDVRDSSKILADFAKLVSASVQRERLKSDFERKVSRAAVDVEETAKAAGLSDAAVATIKSRILGIAS